MDTPEQEFLEALKLAGFIMEVVHMDGQLHRVQVLNDRGYEKSGSYCGYLDGHPAGWYQNFKIHSDPVNWKYSRRTRREGGRAGRIFKEEVRRQRLEAEARRRRRDEELAALHGHNAELCRRLYKLLPPAGDNGYLARKGVRARMCELRLAIQPALGGMKHLNRLEQVLASAELRKFEASEGVLLDREDNVVCAVSANLFLVMDDRLLTPRLDLCGVRGVVRSQILARFSARCEQRRIMLDLLQEADEVFICNSVRGIVPVTRIDEQEYRIGPTTRELQTWMLDGARKA